MKMPSVRIDLEKLLANTKKLNELCAGYGIQVAGVVKCCCGSPEVARILEEGGCSQIADSRIENIKKMREAGILSEMWLLRLPLKSEIAQTVKYADLSLNSEPDVLQSLSDEAVRQDKLHRILLMIDVGDRREGVLPGEAVSLARYVRKLPGLVLAGIGTNLTCFGGIVPDENNMERLAAAAREIQQETGRALQYVSAGNSSSIEWMLSGRMPKEINHLRLGESILFGRETCDGIRLPQTHDDVFILRAEVIESAVKPSRTEGTAHLDAFGKPPAITDRGNHRRILLGIGREDIVPEGLFPVEPGLHILGASSDHMIADAEEMTFVPQPGDVLSFRMNYAALLHAMTSEYVGKEYVGGAKPGRDADRRIICAPYAGDASSAEMKQAPDALLAAGLEQILTPKCPPVFLRGMKSEGVVDVIADACRASFESDSIPYVIGGDHTVAAGLAEAAVKCWPGAGWVVFSAHGDLHKKLLPGKCAAGTALSHVIATGISPDNLVIIGLRALDAEERELLQVSGVHVFTMEHIDRLGIAEVMIRALTALRNTQRILVDFAINILDLGNDPGNLSPGISLRETHCAMEMLADSGKVGGVVLSEFEPAKDVSGISARKICALAASLAGKRIL